MPRVVFSPAAQNDLEKIWDYTASHWGEAQAVRYIRDIQSLTGRLVTQEAISRPADYIRSGYRKAQAGSHILYFQQRQETVIIVRILHQRMDPDRHL